MMNYLTVNKEELCSKHILLTFLKNKKDTILPLIIVFCLPVLLYLQTLSFGFTYADDNDIIINNITFLSNFRNAPQAFLKDAFLEKGIHLYRPMQTLSYMADIRLSGGNNTWMYHLTNILLLGLIACLLFLLFRKFLVPLKLALLSTLVYCVHPLFTSSIAWIPARGDLLLTFFSLLSFLFFIEHLQKKKVIYLFLHWLTFTLALFCKETAVALPLLFIIYYFTFSSEKRFEKKYILNIVLYAVSGLCWFWLRSIAIGNFSIQNEVKLIPLISNIQTIPESLVMFFLPFNIKQIPSFSLFKTLIGLGIIIMIVVLFFINKERSKKEKIFCLCWFLFLLLPTLLYKTEYIDYLSHRFFIPLIGLLLFILFILPKKWFEKENYKGSWLMIAVLIILSSVTFVKSRSYSDPMTYYNLAIWQSPDNALMYNNRGYVKFNMNDFQEAINDYTKAIELNPNFSLAYNNRGLAYSSIGDLESAIKEFDKAITLNPNSALAYINRGNIYCNEGNNEMGIKYYNKAIGLNANDAGAYCNRGLAFKAKGMLKEAEQDFKMYEKLKNN
jgi:hypothetical protein